MVPLVYYVVHTGVGMFSQDQAYPVPLYDKTVFHIHDSIKTENKQKALFFIQNTTKEVKINSR